MFGNDVNLPIPTGFPTGTEVWRSDRSNPHSALPGDAVNIAKGVKAIVNGMVTSGGKLDLDKTLGRTKTTDVKLSDIRKVGMQGIMYEKDLKGQALFDFGKAATEAYYNERVTVTIDPGWLRSGNFPIKRVFAYSEPNPPPPLGKGGHEIMLSHIDIETNRIFVAYPNISLDRTSVKMRTEFTNQFASDLRGNDALLAKLSLRTV